MKEANLKLIARLKGFIHYVFDNHEARSKVTQSDKAFIRNRKLPFDKLILFLTVAKKRSLSVEITSFFKCSNISYSNSALTQQRAKLKHDFFIYWNTVLCQSFYDLYEKWVKKWKGYRIVAADGSTLNLFDKQEVSQYFGGQNNQFGDQTMARTFFCYDVLNNLMLSARITPYKQAEIITAYEQVETYEPDMIVVYDRNFCNYKTVFLHYNQEREIKFVIRVKEYMQVAKELLQSNKKSIVTHLYPSVGTVSNLKTGGYIISSRHGLPVRLVKVILENGTIEILMTNLFDQTEFPDKVFKQLYFYRWGVETHIGMQKNVLQMEMFSGHSLQSILQDFYASIFMINLHSIIIKAAEDKPIQSCHCKHRYQLNKSVTFSLVKDSVLDLFMKSKSNEIIEELLTKLHRFKLPIRKGRTYLRTGRRNKRKGKYMTFLNYKPVL
jgi:hypothetical protein